MSRVPEKVVAEVVREASIKMSDARYAQTMVGSWVQTQPAITKYVSAHVKELGGAEGVVNVAFHAQLIATCIQRHTGRSVRKVSFEELDVASNLDRVDDLKKRQPAIFDYLEANVENPEMRSLLALVALALDFVH
jgi:hypothetical protein